MDFLKNIFGKNNTSKNQDHFVVDENGIAQDSHSMPIIEKQSTPTHAPDHVASQPDVHSPVTAPITKTQTSTPAVDEVISDTSAFDELMAQAESSVDSRVLDTPVLDPEFQKAKDEIQNEEGIEIFPAE